MDNSSSLTAASGDSRRQPRTHIFVAATLYADSGSSPVNIRNLSASGVLIEAAVIPAPGSRIILKRGSLEASGIVAWRQDRRAGLAFEAAIRVADWMSRRPGNHQELVDQLLSCVRAENRAPAAAAVPARQAQFSIEAELMVLQADLDRLSSRLCDDPGVIAAHPEVQLLDISAQRIGRLLVRLKRAA